MIGVCLEIVTIVKMGSVRIVVTLEFWFRSVKVLKGIAYVSWLDSKQSSPKFLGQYLKILNSKSTGDVGTMNVPNSE